MRTEKRFDDAIEGAINGYQTFLAMVTSTARTDTADDYRSFAMGAAAACAYSAAHHPFAICSTKRRSSPPLSGLEHLRCLPVGRVSHRHCFTLTRVAMRRHGT
jgi:hypothetical protein